MILKVKASSVRSVPAVEATIVKTLDLCCFSCFFPNRLMVFVANNGLVRLPEIGIARTTPIDRWNRAPKLSTAEQTTITDNERNNLARFPTQCEPYPMVVDFLANKRPNLIQFERDRGWIARHCWNERLC